MRWNYDEMLDIGMSLFNQIYRKKRLSNHNHDIHFLSRNINEWLHEGINSLISGTYIPDFLKRYYFKDEMVEQLPIQDRILQHILLKVIKPTFKYITNSRCYHLAGPAGVKHATAKIKSSLQDNKYQYFIRADIKSFYKSIRHCKLIEDINNHFDDPKLTNILSRIIKNPIESPFGYKNPDTGIALRGPLSQFFSAIYLKPLDDAFSNMEVEYLRYQDDILILCKSKRQQSRCKNKMLSVLSERRLYLSRRKTKIGKIKSGFHFLGITYQLTQPSDNTNITHDKISKSPPNDAQLLNTGGGNRILKERSCCTFELAPHPRTIRNAREQVKWMVNDSVSRSKIKRYLTRWLCWWVQATNSWTTQTLLQTFIGTCHDPNIASIAIELKNQDRITELHTGTRSRLQALKVSV